jgi:hypothetical protein
MTTSSFCSLVMTVEPSKLRWSEDNMVPETITNENKMEHLQFDKFSKLSVGSGKALLSYQGSDLGKIRILRMIV